MNMQHNNSSRSSYPGKKISFLNVIHEREDMTSQNRYEEREQYQVNPRHGSAPNPRDNEDANVAAKTNNLPYVGRLREKYSNPDRFQNVSSSVELIDGKKFQV